MCASAEEVVAQLTYFADSVRLLALDGVPTYLELGPGAVLAGLLDGCLPGGEAEPLVLATARDWRTLHGEHQK